ncbi:hypothetical protein F3F93_11030 [Mariprofundus sp. KV]|nr:hypothetical protein [Mariprofundus sp. KV]
MDDFGAEWLKLKQDKSMSAYNRSVKVLEFSMMDRDQFIDKISQITPMMKDEYMYAVVDAVQGTFEPYVRQRVLLNLAACLIEQGRTIPQKLAITTALYLRGEITLISDGKNKTKMRNNALAQAVYDVVEAHDICPTKNSASSDIKSACDIVHAAYNDHYTPHISIDVVEYAWKKLRNTVGKKT